MLVKPALAVDLTILRQLDFRAICTLAVGKLARPKTPISVAPGKTGELTDVLGRLESALVRLEQNWTSTSNVPDPMLQEALQNELRALGRETQAIEEAYLREGSKAQ